MPAKKKSANEKPKAYIGCCGAYCKTCRVFKEGACKGCKLGYAGGKRDIKKARCKIKKCCFGEKKLQTCADCRGYEKCPIIGSFHNKEGYKYKKYKEATLFIIENGYEKFLKAAKNWKGACGKLR